MLLGALPQGSNVRTNLVRSPPRVDLALEFLAAILLALPLLRGHKTPSLVLLTLEVSLFLVSVRSLLTLEGN